MKTINTTVLAALLLSANAHAGNTVGTTTTEVEIPLKALLSPEFGFEQKNIIQVVLYGSLPNQCYSLSNSVIRKQKGSETYLVRQFATHDTAGVCSDENSMPDQMKAPVPFTNEVNVGHLVAGNYAFQWLNEDGSAPLRRVVVVQNKASTVDTLPYAAVSGIDAPAALKTTENLMITLTGVLSTTCTQLNSQVETMKEDDVEVVLPTITVRQGVCGMIEIYFTKNVDLGKLTPGIHLVYVRSMSGQSFSKVVVVN